MKKQKLSTAARRLYRQLRGSFGDWDPDELLVLDAAVQAYDRWQSAMETIDAEGLTTRDRFGQLRLHPAFEVEKTSRAAMLAAIRQLGAAVPAEIQADVSSLARHAAMSRWNRGRS